MQNAWLLQQKMSKIKSGFDFEKVLLLINFHVSFRVNRFYFGFYQSSGVFGHKTSYEAQ